MKFLESLAHISEVYKAHALVPSTLKDNTRELYFGGSFCRPLKIM